ncbi:MAG: polysaccharide deacetylase family protein [Terriglobales bacterium]
MKRALDLLGFPSDAKLLIIHGDDLGMCHSVNAATFKALDEQAISSASAMVPCPWFSEVAEYARGNPGSDLGVHLTLTSEWKHYRWRPITGDQYASLVDDTGYFVHHAEGAGWDLADAQMELAAQVVAARRAGVIPTHIDSHALSVFENIELSRAYAELGRRNGIPFLISGSVTAAVEHIVSDTDIVVDKVFSIRPGFPEGEWKEYYLRVLRSITPGLNQLIVHLGNDGDELRAVTSGHAFWGAAWRQRDYDVVMSDEFKSGLRENNIQLIGWNKLNSLRQSSATVSQR